MQKYRILSKLGSGAFGSVEKAENRETKEIVAIKKLKRKYSTWDECLQLPEVKALRKLMHPNIIKLKELIRLTTEAYFIFEYIDRDLYKLCQSLKEKGKQLTETEIKNIAIQVAQALAYIHKQGFFHRDLKPENLLIAQDNTVKIIDFGLAKEIRSKPPFTDYVSTRWYRAPQILLRSPTYSAPVDVFAFGCVLAELYLMKPLFMGSSEIDQLSKVCSLMGTPTAQDWPDGVRLAGLKGYNFPQYSAIPLASAIPNCSSEAINLIGECLKWDPTKRITMNQILNHPYFKGVKIDIKPKEEERINPFDGLEKPKVSDITEHEFDAILNGFSKMASDKTPQSKPNRQKVEEDVDFGMPRLRLVEPILHKQPKVTPLLKQTHSLSPSREFPFSKPSNSNQKSESDSYGGYMPSFGGTETSSRFKKGSLGMVGLESIKR